MRASNDSSHNPVSEQPDVTVSAPVSAPDSAAVSGNPAPWQAIPDFWFGAPGSPEYGQTRPEWFRKNAEFDAVIADRFGALLQQSLAGQHPHWPATPQAGLAWIVLLDQFTRNSFRDTPNAFAGDPLALQMAQTLVANGQDRQLLPVERWFVYMPFEHAEDMEMQEQALSLFTQLTQEASGFEGVLDYARRHYEVVARFGRFPHRNAILGRVSTPEEEAFLLQPGSRF